MFKANHRPRNLSFFSLIMLVLLFSCGRQEAEKLSPDREKTQDEINQGEACGKTKFENGFLYHQNLIQFFSCMNWTKKYPRLYSSFIEIKPVDWDHFFVPLDQEFFSTENRQRRNKFFRAIKRLDNKGSLDDLSEVMRSMMVSNFYDSLWQLLSEAESNELGNLTPKELARMVVNKDEIKNFFKIINVDQTLLKDLNYLISGFARATRPLSNGKDIRAAYAELMKNSEFKKNRKTLISSILNEVSSPDFNPLHQFVIPAIIGSKKDQSKRPYLYDLVQRPEFNQEKLVKLISFPVFEHANLVSDYRILKSTFKTGVPCAGDPQLTLQTKYKTEEMVYKFNDLKQDNFNSSLLDLKFDLLLAEEVCGWRYIKKDNISLDVFELVDQTSSILSDPWIHEILQFAFSLPLDHPKKDLSYVINTLSSEVLENTNNLNRSILASEPLIFHPLHKILKDVDGLSYFALANWLTYFLRSENIQMVKGFKRVWDYFGTIPLNDGKPESTVQDFLLNVTDTIFRNDLNYDHLLDFFEYANEDLPVILPKLASSWTLNDDGREKTFNALLEIAGHFKGPEVLADLRELYSRQGILDIILTISKNVEDAPDLSSEIRDPITVLDPVFDPNDYLKFPKVKEPFSLQVIIPNASKKEQLEFQNCIKDLSKNDLYYFIKNYPASCASLGDQTFRLKVFNWLQSIDQDYAQFYQTFSVDLFGKDGILSRGLLRENLMNLLVIRDHLYFDTLPGNNINKLVDLAKEHLFQLERLSGDGKGYFKEFEGILKLYSQVFFENNESSEQEIYNRFQSFILKSVSEVEDQKIKDYLKNLGLILKDYSQSNYVQKQYKQFVKCSDLDTIFGIDACPEAKAVKKAIQLILHYAVLKNGESPEFIRLAVEGILPEHGTEIPFENKDSRKSVLTLKDLLVFSFDFNDQRYKEKYKIRRVINGKKKEIEKLGDMGERFEGVVRDIQFDSNQLGAYWQNEMARAEKFNKTSVAKHKLFKLCTKKVISKCGKRLNKETLSDAKNVVDGYNSVNQLSSTIKHEFLGNYNHSDTIQSLLVMMVKSSSKRAQKSTKKIVFDLPDFLNEEELKEHNGHIATTLANVFGFRNQGRYVKDRFSNPLDLFSGNSLEGDERERSSEKVLANFINSYEFKRVNQKLFQGFELNKLQDVLYQVIRENIGMTSLDNGQFEISNCLETNTCDRDAPLIDILSTLIDWIDGLNYQQVREVESLVGNLLVLATYLGVDGENPELDKAYNLSKYQNVHLKSFVYQANKLIKMWPSIKNKFPSDYIVYDSIKPLLGFSTFLVKKLNKDNPETERMVYYQMLNDSFLILQNFLVDKNPEDMNGLDVLKISLLKPINKLFENIKGAYTYLKRLHYEKGNNGFDEDKNRFKLLGENLIALSNAEAIQFKELRQYIFSNSIERIIDINGQERNNPQYLETPRLLLFLVSKPDGKSQTRLFSFLDTILNIEHTSVEDFINHTFNPNILILVPNAPINHLVNSQEITPLF
jgi:hypothetical protein